MFNSVQLFEFEDDRNDRPPLTQYKIALAIATFLIILLSIIALVAIFDTNDRNETPESPLKIILRTEWNATKSKNNLDDYKLPIDRIIIIHTSTSECYNRTECTKIVKQIQRNQMEPPTNFDDIIFNFLIGGDGNIYEGRGWKKVGAHTKNYNSISIGLAFIGNFEIEVPNEAQLRSGFTFISEAQKIDSIRSNFNIFGQCQFDHSRYKSPGKAFYKIIQKWSKWSSEA